MLALTVVASQFNFDLIAWVEGAAANIKFSSGLALLIPKVATDSTLGFRRLRRHFRCVTRPVHSNNLQSLKHIVNFKADCVVASASKPLYFIAVDL